MSDLVLEILKTIQADINEIRHEQKSTRIEMTAIREHISAFMTGYTGTQTELDGLRRVERIEKRLQLSDS